VSAPEPGLYTLTETVANPGPVDRRCKDWVKRPEIPAGTVFVVARCTYLPGRVEVFPNGLRECYHPTHATVNPRKKPRHWPLVAAVLAKLHPKHAGTLPLMLLQIQESAGRVLQTLLDDGKITLKDVEACQWKPLP